MCRNPKLHEAVVLLESAKRGLIRNQKRLALDPLEQYLLAHMVEVFNKQRKLVVAEMYSIKSLFSESYVNYGVDDLFLKAEKKTYAEMLDAMTYVQQRGYMYGGTDRLAQLGMQADFSLKNKRAIEYLTNNAASKVTKVNQTTKDRLRIIITNGVEHGWSYDRTAQEIIAEFAGMVNPSTGDLYDFTKQRDYRDYSKAVDPLTDLKFAHEGFTTSRASIIANTEAGMAYERGAYDGAKLLQDRGLTVQKHWFSSGDNKVSAGCAENDGIGWVDIDYDYGNGMEKPTLTPLRFPDCRCDIEMEVV